MPRPRKPVGSAEFAIGGATRGEMKSYEALPAETVALAALRRVAARAV